MVPEFDQASKITRLQKQTGLVTITEGRFSKELASHSNSQVNPLDELENNLLKQYNKPLIPKPVMVEEGTISSPDYQNSMEIKDQQLI